MSARAHDRLEEKRRDKNILQEINLSTSLPDQNLKSGALEVWRRGQADFL
jgi:hypothetical protein